MSEQNGSRKVHIPLQVVAREYFRGDALEASLELDASATVQGPQEGQRIVF
jgi:hypothetical protein